MNLISSQRTSHPVEPDQRTERTQRTESCHTRTWAVHLKPQLPAARSGGEEPTWWEIWSLYLTWAAPKLGQTHDASLMDYVLYPLKGSLGGETEGANRYDRDINQLTAYQQHTNQNNNGPTPNSLPTTERTIPARCRYHIALYTLMHLRVHLRLNRLRTVSRLRETWI